jgi:hypothetical protein
MPTHHLALFEFGNVLFKYHFALRLDARLLPDGVLCKKLVGCCEGCIGVHIRIAFEHVSYGWPLL